MIVMLVLMCLICFPQVASTSWMINFLRLAHFNDDNPELMKLSKEKRKKMKYTVKQKTFLFFFYLSQITQCVQKYKDMSIIL